MATPIPFRTTRHGASAADKLELVEYLLGSDDLVQCAQRGLLWLSVHTQCGRSMCVLGDIEAGKLVTVAAEGISSVMSDDFVIELEDRRHPLLVALAGTEPMYF